MVMAGPQTNKIHLTLDAIRKMGRRELAAHSNFAAVGIGQRQVGFTCANSDHPVLASYGAGPCIIVAAYNRETRQASLAHVDVWTQKESIAYMFRKLRGETNATLEVHLSGAMEDLEAIGKDVERNVQNVLDILNDTPYASLRSSHLFKRGTASEKLAIDARTGNIFTAFSLLNVPLIKSIDLQALEAGRTVPLEIVFDDAGKGQGKGKFALWKMRIRKAGENPLGFPDRN
jgi:hypothetical protein